MSRATLIVIAKEPRPGRVKTRLSPPCTPREAAALALAAIEDTLAAVEETAAARRLLVLEGNSGPWVPPGFDVVAQQEGDLGRRLAGAFAAVDSPALLVGMDTPQLDAALLSRSLTQLERPDADAVLGACPDGGYWAIGLREPSDVFDGVPMSSPHTAAFQRKRLASQGLRCRELERLRDVDTIADARAVAAAHPHTRFARELASYDHGVTATAAAR